MGGLFSSKSEDKTIDSAGEVNNNIVVGGGMELEIVIILSIMCFLKIVEFVYFVYIRHYRRMKRRLATPPRQV